mmetsp:Transcript_9324/g.17207  ORF Transcript_9324/g.17207 Transcript_9324/m.17207 type:complete len:212 (-) Transcript_9324:441-1076(-)
MVLKLELVGVVAYRHEGRLDLAILPDDEGFSVGVHALLLELNVRAVGLRDCTLGVAKQREAQIQPLRLRPESSQRLNLHPRNGGVSKRKVLLRAVEVLDFLQAAASESARGPEEEDQILVASQQLFQRKLSARTGWEGKVRCIFPWLDCSACAEAQLHSGSARIIGGHLRPASQAFDESVHIPHLPELAFRVQHRQVRPPLLRRNQLVADS